jgi:polysaccharide chain length determinant protein (PEP-CTERM system associated)
MDSFDIQKYLNIAIKRKWCLILPFLITVLGGFTYLLVAPRIYEAQTLILVQQQKVPEDYVQSVVSTTLAERLNTIQQQVTSRTNLESIIKEFGVYESSDKYSQLDSKVEALRSMISITTSKGSANKAISSFTISFRCDDPKKAMDVTNKLAFNFTSENLKIREEQAIGTSTFLSDELKATEEQLKQKEEELKQYSERYMGGLPDQLQTNLNILGRLSTSLEQLNANLRDAENRRTSILKDIAALDAAPPAVSAQGKQEAGQQNDLASLKGQLRSMEARYTKNHPDVISLRETIAAMEQERAESLAKSDSSTIDEVSSVPVNPAGQALRRQLQEIDIDIADFKAKIDETNAQIKSYQAKVEDTPKRQQELLSRERDYESLKELYTSLLNRKLEADLSVSMEKKQKGEQFKVIDSAKIPQKPVEPDVQKIILMTIFLGLGLGCGLAFIMEMMDTSYKTPDDAEKEMQLPVLASFPTILTETELRNIKRKNIFAYAGVSVGFILSVIGILVVVKGVPGAMSFIKGIFMSV